MEVESNKKHIFWGKNTYLHRYLVNQCLVWHLMLVVVKFLPSTNHKHFSHCECNFAAVEQLKKEMASIRKWSKKKFCKPCPANLTIFFYDWTGLNHHSYKSQLSPSCCNSGAQVMSYFYNFDTATQLQYPPFYKN